MIYPDKINFLSTLPAYINFGNPIGNILISGNIADGNSTIFSVTIPTTSNNTRFDVYGTNLNTNIKQLFTGTSYPVIYQPISFENVDLFTAYTPTSVSVSIEVFNFTGSPISLINQTIRIQVVEYQIPY